MSLSAHPLVAPVFTYDHELCLPTNFILNQKVAEQLSGMSTLLALLPLFLWLLAPGTWNCCPCCRDKGKIKNFDASADDS